MMLVHSTLFPLLCPPKPDTAASWEVKSAAAPAFIERPAMGHLGASESDASQLALSTAPRFLAASSGFTLLEIVVAVAILGIGVAMALQIFSGGFKNIYRMEQAYRAMNHAENVMNEVLSDQTIVSPTDFSGELDQDFSYSVTVTDWEIPGDGLFPEVENQRILLLKVEVDVHFQGDPNGRLYRAVSLKSVSLEPLGSSPVQPSDAIRQLFGGGQ